MNMTKFYAVRQGNHLGVFFTWNDCQKQVKGIPNAEFKIFTDFNEANEWLNQPSPLTPITQFDLNSFDILVFTDGGCRNHGNKKGKHVKKFDPAAYAGLIAYNDQRPNELFRSAKFGATNNQMELRGLITALEKLIKYKYNNENILCGLDSKYVLTFVDGKSEPKSNETLVKRLQFLVQQFPNIHFAWVKGHEKKNGYNDGNILVDHELNLAMDELESQHQNENDN